jgi:kelch-like protein 1/4/5
MTPLRKVIFVVVLLFFINGSFVATFNPVSALGVAEDSWTSISPISQARSCLGVVAVDNKIYAIGGIMHHDVLTDMTEMYDSNTNTWTILEPIPTPRFNFGIVESQGKIYCIGGCTIHENYTGMYPCSINECYDIVTNSWSTKTATPVKGDSYACVMNGQNFVLSDNDLFMYDIAADSRTQKPLYLL